jgi:hypothetical protein
VHHQSLVTNRLNRGSLLNDEEHSRMWSPLERLTRGLRFCATNPRRFFARVFEKVFRNFLRPPLREARLLDASLGFD